MNQEGKCKLNDGAHNNLKQLRKTDLPDRIVISIPENDPENLINGLRRCAKEKERTLSAQARIFLREGIKKQLGIGR